MRVKKEKTNVGEGRRRIREECREINERKGGEKEYRGDGKNVTRKMLLEGGRTDEKGSVS